MWIMDINLVIIRAANIDGCDQWLVIRVVKQSVIDDKSDEMLSNREMVRNNK